MPESKQKSRFSWIPSWALSLFSAVFIAIIVGFINSLDINDTFNYISWSVMITIACFLICLRDPQSVVLTSILCNILNLLPAIFDDSFWTTSFGLIIGIGIIVSIIAAIIGSMLGRRSQAKSFD